MSTFNYQDESFVRTLMTQRHLHHVSELAHEVVRLRGELERARGVAEQLRHDRETAMGLLDVEREAGRIARDKAIAQHRARRRLHDAARAFLTAYIHGIGHTDELRALERALERQP